MSDYCNCESRYRAPAGYKSEGSEWEYVSNYVCDLCEEMVRVKARDVKIGDRINSYGKGFMVYPVREIKINAGEKDREITVVAGNNSNMPNNYTSSLNSEWLWKVIKK